MAKEEVDYGFRTVEKEVLFDMNTGDPGKIVSPLTYLKKTILDMHGAKNRLTNMVNADLNGHGHFNATDLATLEESIKSIDSGISYLDTLQHAFEEVGVIDMRSK